MENEKSQLNMAVSLQKCTGDQGMLIPASPDFSELPEQHLGLQKKRFSEERCNVLAQLPSTIPGFWDTVSTLNPGDVYRVVYPDGGALNPLGDGTLSGTLRNENGEIVTHAKFKKLKPGLLKSAYAIGSQCLLVSFAIQLHRIEQALDKLSLELHNDRLGQIDSGLMMLDTAGHMVNVENRNALVLQAIQSLYEGIAKACRELKLRTNSLPELCLGFWDNWGLKPKHERIEREMKLVFESFDRVLKGVQGLALAYSALGEPEAARRTMASRINCIMGEVEMEQAIRASRWMSLPDCSGENLAPETQLRQFVDQSELLCAKMDAFPVTEHLWQGRKLEIEFEPSEIRSIGQGGAA
jgi:hypothetical protein